MCEDCEEYLAVLPSIESFQTRLKLPKVYYLFYDYFFKAVMGEARWKRHYQEDKRFGTSVAEAFAHALLENNYFAWLFDYKCKNEGSCNLKTEYEIDDTSRTSETDHSISVFCGDLAGVEIALPESDGEEYRCLQEESSSPEAYEAARTAANKLQEEILKEAVSAAGHKRAFDAARQIQERFSRDEPESSRDRAKKKRKCMRELKVYTGSAVRSGSERRYKGWSDEGKKFLFEMTGQIKDDVALGSHAQWEKMYRRICEVIKQSEERENHTGESERYVVDCGVMYEEV